MAHIAFISLYDEHCHGMRLLVAALKAAGHRATLICFKQYTQVPVEQAHEVREECHIQVLPDGDYINSYSYPATETDYRLVTDLINERNPDLVGFGFTATQQTPARELSRRVREACGRPIIFGGPHPTTSPEWSLDHADYVCRGEADEAILDIAEALDRGDDLRGIQNICYRNAAGEMVANPLRPILLDLDDLPFPDHSDDNFYIDHAECRQGSPFPESELNHTYLVMTARGCPFHCSFCYNAFMQGIYPKQRRVRERSLDRVLEELAQAKARMGGHFYLEILDSVFTLRPERVAEFCRRYHETINLPFWCYTHPTCVREETIRPLAECPNCEYVIMGIQSASDEIGRDTFHRVHSSETVLAAAEVIHQTGLRVFYDIITNVPGETEAMCRANLDLLRRLPKPWRLRLTKISLFPEYEIREATGQTKCVNSQRYRLWNALYFLAQDVDLSDAQIDALLSDPVMEQFPEILEQMNGAFETRFRDLDDTRSRLRIEQAFHQSTRERLAERDCELADIKWRKGFRLFYSLSQKIESKEAVARRSGHDAGPAAAPDAHLAAGEHLQGTLALAQPTDKVSGGH